MTAASIRKRIVNLEGPAMPGKKRKAIQIAVTETQDSYPVVYALCDDGSITRMVLGEFSARKWQDLAPIPPRKDEL
jgi:hypothetical protein